MSISDQAKYEMERAGFEAPDIEVMSHLLDIFFGQWDSGGAVWAMAPVLQRLIAGKPLTPLTGMDDEWLKMGGGVYQNRRCSTIFKSVDLEGVTLCYDIDTPGRPEITFPYDTENVQVSSPVVEIEINTDG